MKVSLSDLYQTQDRDNLLDNSGDNSPSSTTFGTFIISSSKRSRRAIPKKVVTVPIKDVEASRFKGDLTLPSDSWSWRKYGQKPIKGSPYPRGYYRCSSSKGCPARKQVERSRSDPSLIVITYSYDHNHTWQTSRNHHQNRHTTTTSISPAAITAPTTTTPLAPSSNPKIDNNQNHLKLENIDHHQHEHDVDTCEEHMEPPLATMTDDLGWFAVNHHHEDHPFLTSCNINDLDMANIFPIGEEEELFADLGELPECSAVFCQAAAPQGGQMGPRWCGTTS